MNVAIFSAGKPISEAVSLATELQRRGHGCDIVKPRVTVTDLSSGSYFEQFSGYDLIYYRTGLGDAGRAEFARHLNTSSIQVVNRVVFDNALITNKIHQSIVVLRHKIHIPKTLVGRGWQYEEIVEQLGERFILKAAVGIQGAKVELCTSFEQYNDCLENYSGDVLMQEFIKNDGDYRVFLIGGKTHEIFKRTPKDGGFKANISQGGTGSPVTDTALRERLSAMAEQAATALGFDVVGIDIIISHDTGELCFIESNVNPGWKGLDQAVGCDTAGALATYLETVFRR